MASLAAAAPVASTRRPGFHRLRVGAAQPLTADSVAITFDVPPELLAAYRFAPGQHVTIRSDHGGAGVRRSYSIAAPVGGPLRIGVKRLPGGAFSTWATEALQPGAELEVMTPAGRFGAARGPANARRLVALAAGSGITPVLSVVASALADEPATEVGLLLGNRTAADVMFAEDLADLKDRHPGRFQLLHFLSREPQVSPLRAGRLDGAKLTELLADGLPAPVDDWYLCGPAEAVKDWRQTLIAHGIEPGRVHRELFHRGPSIRVPRAPAVRASGRLAFTLDGRSSRVDFAADDTVLDAVLRSRPEAPFACRAGVCGTCRAALLTGEVQMDANFALEEDELSRGFVLTCQARPASDELEVDYDR